MALLWRAQRPPVRGPKPGLTIDQIVAKAIGLADAGGLAGVSMRRVSDSLGVAPMSLYTYVPAKAELIDAMLDSVLGEAVADLQAAAMTRRRGRREWRRGLEERARADRELYQRHPWVLQLARPRALLGPNEIALLEASLSVVANLGLTGREMMAVVDVVGGYVAGAAVGLMQAAEVATHTGQTDEEWWSGRETLLDEMWDAERYPTISAIDVEGGFDVPSGSAPYNLQYALDDFEFGLARLLDGIESYVEQRRLAGGASRSS